MCADFVVKQLTLKAEPSPYVLQGPAACQEQLLKAFQDLQTRPGWANARDADRMVHDVEDARARRGTSSAEHSLTLLHEWRILS